MNSKRKQKLVGVWLNKREVDKLDKIREKLQTRDYAKTVRELIRKERV